MGTSVECLSSTGWQVREAADRSGSAFDEEAALVRRAQASDEMAFCEIVDRYQSKVFSIIHRMLRNNTDAEDIAQEVFANAFLSIQKYKSQGSLLSWLYRITVNQCYEYLRRKKVRPLVYESDYRDEDGRNFEVRCSARLVDASLADWDYVLKLLARVSEQERLLLMLREVEGYSIQELSHVTGINESTVKVKLLRARRKLLKAAARKT